MDQYSDIISNFEKFRVPELKGRYITNTHISPLLKKLPEGFSCTTVGSSECSKPIYAINYGNGPIKILVWSQMHGNESTCTKALFDAIFSFYSLNLEGLSQQITLCILPILNPDGAERYTRLNSNLVDLNRDAKQLTQIESRTLQSVFNSFNPDFCFNMHDQRTLFSAGQSPYPATVSFLSPAQDIDCSVTETRLKAMAVINQMNALLQQFIPNQVGRYDDAFNINCVGDFFQSKGVPTILFEAGHFQEDYDRDTTRKFILIAFLEALLAIAKGITTDQALSRYIEIPENDKLFFDIVIKKTYNQEFLSENAIDFGLNFEEVLQGKDLHFIPTIAKHGDLSNYFGHQVIDAKGKSFSIQSNGNIEIDGKSVVG